MKVLSGRNAILGSLALWWLFPALTPLPAAAQTPLGTEFTYQGSLVLGGSPVDGTADFQFKLFGAAAGGAQIGSTQAVSNVTVASGGFTVTLDFGAGAFTGDKRFLEIAVRSPAGSGSFTTLSPRQPLTATPYALKTRGVDGSSLDASDGSPTDALFVDGDGKVGIGTTAPEGLFHVNGPLLWGGAGTGANQAWSAEDGLGMFVEQAGAAPATSRMRLQVSKSSDFANYAQLNIDANNGFSFLGLGSGNNRVGIGTATPAAGLHIKREAIPPGGTLLLEGETHTYMSFYPDGLAAGRKGFFGFPSAGSDGITLWNEYPGGDIDLVTTNGGATRVSVLEITGADLAEKFPTSHDIEPGMVVAIDPAHPGQLCLARGAYNPRVAGVVSGANDFASGAVLGNLPGHEDALPVALSGRVYVHCDAGNGAIEPGDLLTTSDVPGHAMKATDRERFDGTIIGKAMTRLTEGRGHVLVLVNLQ